MLKCIPCPDDLLRATKKLKILGTGFTVIPLSSGRYLVQSVPGQLCQLFRVPIGTYNNKPYATPGELSLDQTSVLHQSEECGGVVSVGRLETSLGWDRERSERTLDKMVGAGLVWIDSQAGTEPDYWVTSIFTSARED